MYQEMTEAEKAQFVQDKYNSKDGLSKYATSRDYNLRELEIDFIIDTIKSLKFKDIPRILDIGCGNGYTDIRIAEQVECAILGIDFSQTMIDGARKLAAESLYPEGLKFIQGNIKDISIDSNCFSVAISERLLLNLPSREIQNDIIRNVHRVLKPHGIYIMVEGSKDGLTKLNLLREQVGLSPIPDADEDNISSLKFDEDEIESFLKQYFYIVRKQHFGMYYLISRIVHPLLVAPDEPKFDARINEIARQVANITGSYGALGHIVGYVLRKR